MQHNPSLDYLVKAISEARKAKGLSQSELGRRLGVPQSYLSNLEHGKRDIRVSNLLDIARFLGYELMLVPLPLVPTINAVIGSEQRSKGTGPRPLYSLDDIDTEEEIT